MNGWAVCFSEKPRAFYQQFPLIKYPILQIRSLRGRPETEICGGLLGIALQYNTSKGGKERQFEVACCRELSNPISVPNVGWPFTGVPIPVKKACMDSLGGSCPQGEGDAWGKVITWGEPSPGLNSAMSHQEAALQELENECLGH